MGCRRHTHTYVSSTGNHHERVENKEVWVQDSLEESPHVQNLFIHSNCGSASVDNELLASSMELVNIVACVYLLETLTTHAAARSHQHYCRRPSDPKTSIHSHISHLTRCRLTFNVPQQR